MLAFYKPLTMNGKQLKNSILQWAIQGKLVPQDPSEGTADDLLQQIRAEKGKLVGEKKLKKSALDNESTIQQSENGNWFEGSLCIDDLLLINIPKTWRWAKIKDILDIQTGAAFKKEESNNHQKGVRILRGGNILPNKYIFKDDDVFVMPEVVSEKTKIKEGDIITPAVTSLENIGKMAVIDTDYTNVSAGGFVFILRPFLKNIVHSRFISMFLQSPYMIEMMKKITKKSGAAFYNLGSERMKELYFPLPPLAEQRRIVSKLSTLLPIIARYETAQAGLDKLNSEIKGKLKKSLLQEAIQGKLVPQDPTDEPASALLARIQAEKANAEKAKKRSAKPLTSVVDTPFELPEGWCWTTLEEIGDIVTGSTPSKDVEEYYNGDIPFFKPTDLEQGIDTKYANDHLSQLGYEVSRQIPANSVLVTCIGTIGKTGMITVDGTCNQQINAIISSKAVSSVFLYFVCISYFFQKQIKENASATTIPILNKNNFSRISFPLPPLAEQHRIVSQLERMFKVLGEE